MSLQVIMFMAWMTYVWGQRYMCITDFLKKKTQNYLMDLSFLYKRENVNKKIFYVVNIKLLWEYVVVYYLWAIFRTIALQK